MLLRSFAGKRILVLGDMVLDEYLFGRPARISREAPVLVLELVQRSIRPGGATNTAANLAALGAQVSVAGVIGSDAVGTELTLALRAYSIETSGLIVDSQRATSTKTRIIGTGAQEVQQQIVRIDRVEAGPVADEVRDRIIHYVCASLSGVDGLLVSDYEHGVISEEVIESCLPRARALGLTTVVDAHGDLFRFQGVTAATPNLPEAEGMLHRTFADERELEAGGRAILEGMQAKGVLITRGSDGIALFEPKSDMYTLPVSVIDPTGAVDPTGAGDTVAAVFALALCGGALMRDAAYLANVAGGVVVRKHGAATLSADELRAALAQTHLPEPA